MRDVLAGSVTDLLMLGGAAANALTAGGTTVDTNAGGPNKSAPDDDEPNKSAAAEDVVVAFGVATLVAGAVTIEAIAVLNRSNEEWDDGASKGGALSIEGPNNLSADPFAFEFGLRCGIVIDGGSEG